MPESTQTREQELLQEIERLRAQLEEPQQTVDALRHGSVDAVVIAEPGADPDVYTINRCVRVTELEDIARAIQEGSVDALVMRGDDGEAVYTLHTVHEALRRSEERLRVAVKNSRIIVYTTDRDLRYTWIENPHPDFDPETVIGKRDDELMPPEVAAPLMQLKQEALATGAGRRGEFEILLRGRRHVYDLTIEPLRDVGGGVIGLTVAAMDVTDRKLLEEEQAHHAEKLAKALEQRTVELTESLEARRRTETMAMLGTLSAGIAHDLGNLLVPLKSHLEVLQLDDVSAEVREHIDSLSHSVEYIADLAKRLRQSMTTGRGHRVDETVNLARWCRETEQFFRTIIPNGINLECRVPSNLPAVMLDKIGLTQAVYNLIQNSVRAMRRSNVGEYIVVRAQRDGTERVILSVEDDGPGMTPEVAAQCVESRFTTDAENGGTGLGLPLVKRFVESARGILEVLSTPFVDETQPHGTTVAMRFPLVRKASDADQMPAVAAS